MDGDGPDARQAREFLEPLGLGLVPRADRVAGFEAWILARGDAVIEDYKPLDVECAAMNLALLRGIRERYPEWRYLVDGDGGDENLKDYPIEENTELTIRSVVNNRCCIRKAGASTRSSTRSPTPAGYSRGYVRSYARRASSASTASARSRCRP